jgi:cell division septal protein FtsQ
VEEREPVALVFADRFYEVDEEGMVMPPDEITSWLDLPVISGLPEKILRPGRICADPRLSEALEVIRLCRRLGDSLDDRISEVRVGERGIEVVSLREGKVVLLGRGNYEEKLERIASLWQEIHRVDAQADVIDLRFEDQVVLRRASVPRLAR